MTKKESRMHLSNLNITFFKLLGIALVTLGIQYAVTQSMKSPTSISYDSIQQDVLPSRGYQTKIRLGNVVPEMIRNGIIDTQKLKNNYASIGGIPAEMEQLLTNSSNARIFVTKENSTWLINILWPLGLANRMSINRQSKIAGPDVGNYASTGGWTLGKADNGGIYFNNYPLIKLTSQQEIRVKSIAENIHRPCCNNSAFFQDCNHGSAALALVELGVLQGLSDEEIYKTVLQFNSFWFPQNYTEIALYFQKEKNTDWKNVDPKLALSKDYSSINGWMANVDAVLRKKPGLLPTSIQGGGSCST